MSCEDSQPSEHFTDAYAQTYKINLNTKEHSGNGHIGVPTSEGQVTNRCYIRHATV